MSSTKHKFRLIGAGAALAALAFAVSCRGFFVKPTLSSITVSPSTATIDIGTTNNAVHMTAQGNFNDGSTGTASVSWSIAPTNSGDPVVATIDSSSGIVTSSGSVPGRMTVTATASQNSSITATAAVVVIPASLASIAVNPGTAHVPAGGGTQPFTATGKDSGGNSYDITKVANWVSSNTNVATIDSTGLATVPSSVNSGSTNITATLDGVTSNPPALLQVP